MLVVLFIWLEYANTSNPANSAYTKISGLLFKFSYPRYL